MRKDKKQTQVVLSHPGRYLKAAENLKVRDVPVPEENRYILYCATTYFGTEKGRSTRETTVAYLTERLPDRHHQGLLKGCGLPLCQGIKGEGSA